MRRTVGTFAALVAIFAIGLSAEDPAMAATVVKPPRCVHQRCVVTTPPPAPHGPFKLPSGRKSIPRPPQPR